MSTIIFLGGVRGVGKSLILRNIKSIKKYKLYNIINKINKPWPETELETGKFIKNEAYKFHKIVLDLHYAVPSEDMGEDILHGIRRDFSKNYEEAITPNMIKNMVSKDIKFIFILIDTDTKILLNRIKKSKKISKEYKNNIDSIKNITFDKFNLIFENFRKTGTRVKKYIIYNNGNKQDIVKQVREILENV